jgi:cAMP-dependent protein kinase regulator
MSRQGISAEVYGQFNKKEDFVPKVIEKDADTVKAITELVKKSILFQNIANEDISLLVNAMSIENHEVGDLVI